jgi:hypothetical protein
MIGLIILWLWIGGILLWPEIIEFVTQKMLPWIRRELSSALADELGEFFNWLDDSVVAIRRTAKQLWKAFDYY